MKAVRYFIFIISWLLWVGTVMGQDSVYVLTLSDAIDMAMQQNLAILQNKTGIRADSEQITLEKSGNYPQVRLSTSLSRTSTPTQFPLFFQDQTVLAEVGTRNSFNAQVEGTQKLFDFGQTAHRVKAAQYKLQADRNGNEDRLKQIRTEVRFYFYNVLFYQKMDSIYRAILPLSEELRSISEAQLNNGISIPVDVLQTQTNAEQTSVRLADIRNQKRQSKNQLAELLGISRGNIELSGNLPVIRIMKEPTDYYDSLYAIALKNRGTLQRLTLMSRQQLELANASKALHMPTISLFGAATYYGPHIDALYPEIRGLKTYNLKAGITVSYPLFDGRSSGIRASQLRTQARQLELERDSQALELSTRIRNLLSDLNSLLTLEKSNELSLQLMQVNADVAYRNYEKGAGSRLTYIQARIPAVNAAAALAQTRFAIMQKILALQSEIGSDDISFSGEGK